jgi:catechol 2,3-dioxygenase-like lactoylglutathione lyase family enzyme
MKNKRLSLGQIARNVQNIELSEQWYRDTLGLKHLYTFGAMAFFDADGVRIMLSQTEKAGNDESLIYFKTDDIRARYQYLQQLGVTFTHAPHKIHQHEDGSEEWMAFFTDLEGRPIGLMGKYPSIET